jgi:hypothetical protein
MPTDNNVFTANDIFFLDFHCEIIAPSQEALCTCREIIPPAHHYQTIQYYKGSIQIIAIPTL